MIKETDMVKRCVCMERERGGGGGRGFSVIQPVSNTVNGLCYFG